MNRETAMTPEEMMEIMAGSNEDDGEVSGNSESASENSISDNMAGDIDAGDMGDTGVTEEAPVTEE